MAVLLPARHSWPDMAGFPYKRETSREDLAHNDNEAHDEAREVNRPAAKPAVVEAKGFAFDDGIDASRDLPIRRDVIEDLLPEVCRAAVVGASGSGKSFLILDMAASIVTGTPFAGREVMRRGGFGYIAFEAAGTIDARWKGLREKFGEVLDNTPFFPVRDPKPLVNVDAWDALADTIIEMKRHCRRKYGVPLVAIAIDTVHASGMVEKENDADSWNHPLHCLKVIAEQAGIALIVLHHSGKQSDSDGRTTEGATWRGSGSAPAAMDSVIAVKMERSEGEVSRRYLYQDKSKDGETGYIADIVASVHTVGKKANGKPVTTLTFDYDLRGREAIKAAKAEERAQAKAASRQSTPAERWVLQALRKAAQAEGRETQLSDGRWSYVANPVEVEARYRDDQRGHKYLSRDWKDGVKRLEQHAGLEVDPELMTMSIIVEQPVPIGAFT